MKYLLLTATFATILITTTPFTSLWAASPLIAHEWGTFTSLQDSEGNTMEGLAHEEEALPSFVHGRARTLSAQNFNGSGDPGDSGTPTPHRPSKDADFPTLGGTPTAVTQKMETPVIYFYSQTPQSLKVDVDFPGGIVTQYYPNVSDFSPPLGKVDSLANGHIHWDLDISPQTLPVPPVDDSSIWAPSRKTQSNFISSHGENEKLLFYRGLGNFKTALQVLDDQHGGLIVQNHSDQNIQDAFLLRVTPQATSIRALGAIPTRGQIAVSNITQFPAANALDLVAQSLEKSGLYYDEAQAMVHTWERSYFKTSGLRILYVLPREWTDALLPLNIQPKPTETIRTLVGRVEVLTASEETTLLSQLTTSFQSNPTSSTLPPAVLNLGRFGESKLRRLLTLAQKQNGQTPFVHYVERLIHTAEQQ